MTTLIITEKPSVARDIVNVMDESFVDKKSYFEGQKTLVSFAIGHLVTLCDPTDLGFKSWTLKSLPIVLDKFDLKPISKDTEKQIKVLERLIKKKEVDHIINACDAGREGELIFKYILEYIGFFNKKTQKKVSRLWLQSMTKQAIKDGLENLRNNDELVSLEDAARSRSEADWLVGINASRGLTAYNSKDGGFFLTPCGRVQTPTLSMIVKREKEIQNFISQDYWQLVGTFSDGKNAYEGKWFHKSKNEENKTVTEEKVWSKKQVDGIISKCTNKIVDVEEKERESTIHSPILYNLTSLQREANNKYKFSARQTLSLTQSLYERHKVVTYPRTSSRYLPEDYLGNVKQIFKNLQQGDFGEYAKQAVEKNYLTFTKKVFDNKKVSDHFAIIPTGVVPKGLNPNEKKIYHLILQKFIAVFFPPAKYKVITRISTVEKETFKTEGKSIIDLGWKVIYGQDDQDIILSALEKGKDVITKKISSEQKKTLPPPRYSEASLLSAMEKAGKLIEEEQLQEMMKEKGIGTPATRAAIIEKLLSDKYILREDNVLMPTTKAFYLFDLIHVMDIEELSSPALTGEWEYQLSLVEEGKKSRLDFMQEITTATKKIIESIKGFKEETTAKEADFSPIDGVNYYENIRKYYSEDGEVSIKKILGGRKMSSDEIKTLIVDRKIGPINDFRSKRGNIFSASIEFNSENKIKFIFGNSEEEIKKIDLEKEGKLVGISPLDQSEVYQTMNNYLSKSFLAGEKTGLNINRVILGQEIDEDNIKKMLAGEKTELIKGFRSIKKKRKFNAFLKLDEKGKAEFVFEERKPKAGKTKKK